MAEGSSCEEEHLAESGGVVTGVENIVLSFLTQLVQGSVGLDDEEASTSAQYTLESGTDDQSNAGAKKPTAQQQRAKARIQLQLVNRNKNSNKIDEGPKFRTLTYPRKCHSGSARPVAQLLRVLDLTHEALVEGVPMTKRDMYYKDVPLFKNQRIVDNLVDDLAATLDVDRSDLNVRAASKGLLCGSGLAIHLFSGETLRAMDTEGTLIPVGEDIQSFGLDKDVDWVLVVEKEAVFQTLCRLRIVQQDDTTKRGLLITGKGYPDIATRHLVKTLADSLPKSIPIMALVDGDPYGLDILSVYNFGSRAMAHENVRLAAAGRVHWLGVWASELSSLGIQKEKLIPITKEDEKKAFAMLRRPEELLPAKWKKELMQMLFTRRKAEIEILSDLIITESLPPTRELRAKEATAEITLNPDMAMDVDTIIQVDTDIDDKICESENRLDESREELVCSADSQPSTWKTVPCTTRQTLPVSGSHSGLLWYLQKKIGDLVEEYGKPEAL